jgi:hypothetical protein
LFGEFVTDAAGTAGDQNCIAREFHNRIPMESEECPCISFSLRIHRGQGAGALPSILAMGVSDPAYKSDD